MEIKEALQSLHQQQMHPNIVLRVLVYQPTWLMPARTEEDGTLSLFSFSENDNSSSLRIFSDEESFKTSAALEPVRYQNIKLREVNTDEIIKMLQQIPMLTRLVINHGDLFEASYDKSQFPLICNLFEARRVESFLLGHGDDKQIILKQFPSFWVLLRTVPEGQELILAPDNQNRRLAAVFTAQDTANEALAELGEEAVVVQQWSGEQVFGYLATREDLLGIVFNYAGPLKAAAFSIQLAHQVMALGG